MIIDEIKRANVEAMKNKDANLRSIYSIIINKYMQLEINSRTSGKEVTDTDMVNMIVKTIKELEEEKENYRKVGNEEEVRNIEAQKQALSGYLPEMEMNFQQVKESMLLFEKPKVIRRGFP